MPSVQDIIDFASQFEDLAPSKIQLYIKYASLSVPPPKWEELTEFAIINLTCHYLTLQLIQEKAAQQGAIGPVTSESVGDLSRSYAEGQINGSNDPGSLNQTSYGQIFLRLQKSLVITPLLIP